MGLAKEFRDFAMRGNVIDLAVGIIIGGAFGKIVTSAVGDVLMPPIGRIVGQVDFSQLALPLGGTATLKYGAFLQAVVDFTLTALAVFLLVKAINSLRRTSPPPPPLPAAPTKEEVLLTEIRDLLRTKS